MAKEVLIRDAEVLELYQGQFIPKDAQPGEAPVPYYQLRVYQKNQQSDFMTVIKVKSNEVNEVSSLVGSQISILTEAKEYNGKSSYHYAGVI